MSLPVNLFQRVGEKRIADVTVLLHTSVVFILKSHSSTLSCPNTSSRAGEVAKEDKCKGLGTMTSAWEATKMVGILHLEEE